MTLASRKQVKRQKWLPLAATLAGLTIAGIALVVQALTPAGVVIRNQATATYLDSSSQTQSTSSNQVSTTVQEVLGLTLVANQTKFVAEGATIYFPHFLTNAGNATESYTLCLDQTGLVDDFDVSLNLYLDADENGLPDTPGTPLTSVTPNTITPSDGCYAIAPLAGGAAVQIVVEAQVGTGFNVGDQALYQITGYTDTGFDDGDPATGLTDTDTDTIQITDEPTIEVLKSIDVDQGLSPSGPYTVTLTYRNTGLTDAQDLRIEEILPIQTFTGDPGGMTYVQGSARWSHELATEVSLSDSDETVPEIDENNVEMLFCAYDSSCDTGEFQNDRMVAIINSVPAGAEGVITFDIDIESGIAENEALVNVVNFVYFDTTGLNLIDDNGSDFVSNSVTFVIVSGSENPGVVANNLSSVADPGNITEGADDGQDDYNIVYEQNSYDGLDPATSSIPQGGSAIFYNYIWNSGDGVDTFDIEVDNLYQRDGETLLSTPFEPGTSFTLFKPDGVNSLTDTDGDSIADTGPLDPGESYLVILRATPPATLTGDNGGFGWDVTLRATSSADTGISNAVTDHLSEISKSEVDLTNAQIREAGCVDTPVEGCDGEGDGPYAYPANNYSGNTGAATYIPLWVHNVGGAADAFSLAVSNSNSPFTVGNLPAGIGVLFYSVSGGATSCEGNLASAVTSTGGIAAGSSKLICAEVTVAASYVADGEPIDLYFRTLSPTSGEVDIKYDRLDVTQAPALNFIPEHGGQVGPGKFIVYPHLITNTGNTYLECINVESADSLGDDGWNNLVYLDVDGNSELDLGTDELLTDQVLAPGGTFRILVKVFSPAGAVDGVQNVTSLPLTGIVDNNDGDPAICSTEPGDAVLFELEDTTIVSDSNLTVVKSQSLDATCDGVSDDGTFATTSFQVDPGQCVIYELVATNIGTEVLYDLLVRDLTPTFTTYQTSGEDCEVINGGAGTPESPTGPPDCSFDSTLNDGDTGEVRVSVDYLEAGGEITVNFAVKVD